MDVIYQSLQIIHVVIRDYLLLHDISYLRRGCVGMGADVFRLIGFIGPGIHCLLVEGSEMKDVYGMVSLLRTCGIEFGLELAVEHVIMVN